MWEITFNGNEVNQSDLEHIASLIREGYTSGEIVNNEDEE